MSDMDFSGALNLDPSDLVSGADEASDAMGDVGDASVDTSDSLFEIDAAGIAAGGALAGLGTAAQGTLDDTQALRESLGRTAVDMGISSDEANELARSMSDATFPLEDVTGAMDSLSRQGVETEEDMQELATAADDIADATGTTAESVADNLGPAMVGLGDDLEDMPEIADAVTMAVRNTTLETEDLAQVMERSSEELNELGLQTEDSAALIAAYAEETGKSGRTLRRDFNSAINEADGDMEAFADITGVGEDELEAFGDELENADGVTQEYADAANDSLTTTDHLRATFADARLAAAQYLGPLDAIAPAAQTAGIGAMALSTINVGALAPSFATVAAAAAPVTAVVLGLAAAGTALAVVWERDWFDIQDRTSGAVSAIGDALDWLLDGLGSAIETAQYILFEWTPGDALEEARDGIMGPVDDVREAMPNSIGEARDDAVEALPSISDFEEPVRDATDSVTDLFMTWHPAGIVYDHREEILDALPSASDAREAADAFINAFTDRIEAGQERVENAVSNVTEAAGSYLPGSDAEKGRLSELSAAGAAIPETLADNAEGAVGSMTDAMDVVTGAGSGGGSGGAGGGSPADGNDIEEWAAALRDVLEELAVVVNVEGDEASIIDVADARIQRQKDIYDARR